jgi:excisionase family DNA binding protein
MTVREAAERIGISPSLVYALCHEGVIRHTRHGRPGRRGTIRIADEAVEDYLAQAEQEVPADEGELKFIRG